ncbi:MAG: cytochrome c3 family protein [Bacteroidota bacterium]
MRRIIVKRYKRSLLTISIIFFTMAVLTTCIDSNESGTAKPATDKQFAGAATCINCHKEVHEKHIKTAHFLTSQIATEKNILGSFATGKNEFVFNPVSTITMEKRGDSLVQVEYENGVQKKLRPFSIVVGSGKRGQTYLYWFKNNLGQLPVSYFTSAGEWSNSPGYGNKLVFNRPVTSRCLECHTTNAQIISPPNTEPEQFDRNTIIYGIDCQKCHGPAKQHVAFQTQNPTIKTAKFIVNPARFTRRQSLDLCALCHGGRLEKFKPSFSFEAGDTLADYFITDSAAKDVNDIDVHGNQYGLLSASKCFINSAMTCTTCHSAHENETGKTDIFSQKCLGCHSSEKNNEKHFTVCKLTTTLGAAINNNCIDCHMPEQPSRSIAMLLQGNDIPTKAVMRSHFIKVYPEAVKEFLLQLKKSGTNNSENKKTANKVF